MRLNDTLKELCAETGAREAGVERLLDYYIEDCGWSEDSAVEYVCELFENGTIDIIMSISSKQPKEPMQDTSVDKILLYEYNG